MIMAQMIKKYRDPDAEIVIVEKAPVIGGQYTSFNYGENGFFDIGMHLFYESTIPEIDELFTGIMPDEEWNILVNNEKDIAGVFYNGRLQEGTPYVDLRNCPKEKWNQYVAGILEAIKNNSNEDYPAGANAYESLKIHFGQAITDDIFVPVFEKLYYTHARELDNAAIYLTTVNRVALFDKEIVPDLLKSDEIRARICFPDQLLMPNYRNNSSRGFYPKEYGMVKVIEKLKSTLENEGVTFITSSFVKEVEVKDGKVINASLQMSDGTLQQLPVKEIFWTAGLPSLAGALNISLSDLQFDRKHTEDMYINFLFDKKPEMGRLYHFFCFDKGYRSFRVTNFSNYCPAAANGKGYPLAIEFWTKPEDPKSEEELLELAKKELYDFGVINDSFKIIFSRVEKKTGHGFPLPSVKNMNNLDTIKARIGEKKINNIISTGIFSDRNVFFIADVLENSYKKVIQK